MIGKTLSHFKITAKLGEGGMGAVYRADDTKLGREVAIKVLPEEFTASPERLARFEREARALAALNHPNIAGIYEVGEAETDGVHFLVMELAEGEDLAARLSHGPIPVDEALALAVQIAEAFEAAHDRGIVHRDLKPSNLMVSPDGQIKVLDFGLAKAWQDDSSNINSGLTHSPTLTAQMTSAGVILGTAAYMSPEQARGQEADQRSDIWSFGAVLYEMLVGRGLFAESTMSDTLAAVLRADIEWDELPAETPLAVRRLLRRSLERDPNQRLHSVADVRLELQEATSGSAAELETAAVAATPTRVGRLLPAVAVVLALGLIALGVVAWRLAGRTQPVVRALVSPPKGGAFYLESGAAGPVAVSPDGARLAFTARDAAGTPRLWIRDLDDPEPRVLRGTEGAMFPFWSPDSQTVAFTTDFNKLNRIDIAGGPPRFLCDDAGGGKGGTWSDEGVILIGGSGGPLHRADASGGGCEPLTVLDPAFPDEISHRLPRFLPDGQRFLFLANRAAAASTDYRIMIGSLDETPPRELMRNGSQVEMVADHLWFVNQGTLVARPFDPSRELITGEARPIAEAVGELRGPGIGLFSVSQSGVLAFHGLDSAEKRSITWRDRSGQSLGTLGPPGRHLNAVLSPDGKQAAVMAYEEFGFLSVYLYDVATEISTRFTFGEPYKIYPIWSPGGDRIAVTWYGGKAIETLPVFGGGEGEVLWEAGADGDLSLIAYDWSPDGSVLLAQEWVLGEDGQYDLWVLPLDTERAPYPLTETPFNEFEPALSPDGRWMAYISDESGQNEVYVTSFPDQGRKWQLSKDGGASPEWSQRGDELFYLDLDDVLMAVPVDLEGDSFVPGSGSALFQTGKARGSFSVGPEGDRFLIVERQENPTPSQINLLVGWNQLLEARGDS
jgi:Tol biopolymer transport system component